MKYPSVEVNDPLIGTFYREMSPEEYEEWVQWYRDYIKKYENNEPSRRIEEYILYLKCWFGDGPCDGLPNFKARYTLHTLPMSFNIYFN